MTIGGNRACSWQTLRMGGMSRLVGWGAGAVAGLGVGAAAYVSTSAVMQRIYKIITLYKKQ